MIFKIRLLIVVFSSLCNQVASCHAVAGGQPPLQLTLSASPASTTTQRPHLWHTVTFHCPPATNHTPGGRLLSRILAARSSLRDRPALTASPRAVTGPHLDPKYPGCFRHLGPPLVQCTCFLGTSASFISPLAKHRRRVRAAVHPEEPRIFHHHVQPTEGLHSVHDPTGPDHGGAG